MSERILYVYAPAGPPLDYCYKKMLQKAEVYTCIVSPPSEYNMAVLRENSKEVYDYTQLSTEKALQKIVDLSNEIRPSALFTFSECLIMSVEEIVTRLGLRGVGRNIYYGRNKVAMRDRWSKEGIPQPNYRAVSKLADLANIQKLRFPVLIKLAYGAGSIGQQIVNSQDEVATAVERILEATESARHLGKHEFTESKGFPLMIAEEIIQSSTQSWYDGSEYGDYVSVEGLVRDGKYYPLAMTGRLRTIHPFTELGNVAPCVISRAKKEKIVELVTRAVEVLNFENCATHTEVKLMDNGGISFLETAARMGGVAIAKELEEVFNIDYIDLFLDVLFGKDVDIPVFEETSPKCAAASVAMIGCNSDGIPWNNSRQFVPSVVDWEKLVKGRADVQILYSQSKRIGDHIRPYDAMGGALNYGGQVFVTSDKSDSLIEVAYDIIDNLEHHLPITG